MATETKSRFAEILEEVKELTERDKLRWQETPDENRFIVVLQSGSLEIAQVVQEDDRKEEAVSYEAMLFNSRGNPVETINEAALADTQPDLLPKLFRLVRSKVRNTDEVLNRVLQELNSMSRR